MSDTFAPPVGDSSMFGSTITMLKDAGTGARQTHDVIANNVANINTPGFKRTDVSFKEALASELPRYDDPDDLALATDDDRQIQAGPDFDPKPFAVTTSIDDTEQIRNDGSNVDLDQEMAKLSMNSSYSQTIHALLSQQYGRIREAIEEKA